jgi:hypothetical protein
MLFELGTDSKFVVLLAFLKSNSHQSGLMSNLKVLPQTNASIHPSPSPRKGAQFFILLDG